MTSKDYAEEIKDARRKVLECIRKVTEIHVSDYTGTKLDATVLLFEDEECKKTKVAYRATNKRAAGRVVPSEELMAFHLARTGRHIVVNDFLNGHPFPKESLAGGKPWYRSILMIPLLDASNSEAQLCYGILCIDSSQPFHFWPGGG
jgi:GAF domain-containing protein